jgi:integrase
MATARKTTRRPYGAGSLYARRGVWYAHWRADGGRQVKRRVGPMRVEGSREGLTRSQAEAELRRLIAETKPVRMTAGDALTMAELGRRYLANLKRQSRKKATTTAVESILRVWLEPFFAERDLRRITAQDVQDLMTMMEKGERPGPKAKGDRRYGRPVGAKSVRNYIGYLSALLGFAERKGWLPVNVARHIELPGKPESAEIRFLEPLGVRALADAAVEGPYREIDRAMYLTAAMTGLRQGEWWRFDGATWIGPPAGSGSARTTCWASSALRSLVARRAVFRWPTRSRESLIGSAAQRGRAVAMRSCSPIPTPPGRSTRRRSCGASAGRSRLRSSSSRIASTICATRSVRRWLVLAFPCGPCRSGWDIEISRQPSATRTTRRASTSRRL